ncbi:MAG: rhodanese-like domain-containing protein [Planctomycetota bacterium]
MEIWTAPHLAERLQAPDPPAVLDVREAAEVRLAPFPGAVWIPLGELAQRWQELDDERDWAVVCHHGVRSASAAAWLEQHADLPRLINLRGGIDAWSREVDPSVPRY